jgi:protein-tyrosine phosphatase
MAKDPATGTGTGPSAAGHDARMRVLVTCTANQCRSPIAAALLRRSLPVGSRIEIGSAGLLQGGYPVPPDGLALAARQGLDLTGHVSHRIEDGDVEGAALILTMTRQQVREIVALWPVAWPRCFPLKDFVRRAERILDGEPVAGLPRLLARLDAERDPDAVMGAGRHDDVTDPMGRSGRVWRSVLAELEGQTSRLAAVLTRLGAAPATGHRAPPPR